MRSRSSSCGMVLSSVSAPQPGPPRRNPQRFGGQVPARAGPRRSRPARPRGPGTQTRAVPVRDGRPRPPRRRSSRRRRRAATGLPRPAAPTIPGCGWVEPSTAQSAETSAISTRSMNFILLSHSASGAASAASTISQVRGAVVHHPGVEFDPALHAQQQQFGGLAGGQGSELLGGQGVEPAQAVRPADRHHAAV